MADFHDAVRHDMVQEPAETRDGVKGRGAEAGTAHCPGGAGDEVVLQTDQTVVGDGDREAIRSEGGESGRAMVMGLTVDVPGDAPDLRVDGLEQASLAHRVFTARAGDGGERCHGHQAVGAGGAPGRAVLGEAPTGHHGMEVGVGLELSTPGLQDPGDPQESGADEALSLGELCQSPGSGVKQGLIRGALRRADEGTQGFRDGEGAEEMRPRELCVEVVLEPLLRCILLTLGAVAIATGMLDAMVSAPGWALLAAVAVRTAAALLEGADDLTVRGGERGRALQGLWAKGRADLTQSDHGKSPCLRALRRSSASSCPVWVRGRETRVVSSGVWPRERWMRRGCTPASRRWVA
jgi:hypothetical protein